MDGKIRGVIKAISSKGKRNSFTLEGVKEFGKDVWFSGFELNAKKGDEVEFINQINGNFNNFANLEVIKKKEDRPEAKNEENDRTISTLLSYAKDILVAGKTETIDEACELLLNARKNIKRAIEKDVAYSVAQDMNSKTE